MALARKKLSTVSLAAVIAVFLLCWADFAYAQCSPGIPCSSGGGNTWKNGASLGGAGVPSDPNGPTCDGDFMNMIYAEAYLHARREVAMTGQVIRKPDSILEYTCFHQYLNVAAGSSGPIFSETTAWDDREVTYKTEDETQTGNFSCCGIDDEHLDRAIQGLTINILKEYLRLNFSHTYLGGASSINSPDVPDTVSSGGYSCNQMSAVWDLARCNNFGADDDFLSFGQLTDGDPRQLIGACGGHPAPAIGHLFPTSPNPILATLPIGDLYTAYLEFLDNLGVQTITETEPCPSKDSPDSAVVSTTQIRVSNNCDDEYASQELARSYFEYFRDANFPDYDALTAGLSHIPVPFYVWEPEPCAPPVPTGVTIKAYAVIPIPDTLITGLQTASNTGNGVFPGLPGLSYEEHVCINPGCTYVPAIELCIPPL